VTKTVAVAANGDWTAELNVSGLADGTITVTVNGTNDLAAPSKEAEGSFNLDKTVALITPRIQGQIELNNYEIAA
jgi:hypothetical protein